MVSRGTRLAYSRRRRARRIVGLGSSRVSRDGETTAWKRQARFRQAQWREERGYPRGAHPHAGGEAATPVGSRLALQFAMESGANFVSPGALAAVRARLAQRERFEMLRADRLWADLLSSMPLCFNLFGDLAGDEGGGGARGAWVVPDAPEGQREGAVRVFARAAGSVVLGQSERVRWRLRAEPGRRRARHHRYRDQVPRARGDRGGAENGRAGAVCRSHGALGRVRGLTGGNAWSARRYSRVWQDHLLALSMLQHPSRKWTWGRFVPLVSLRQRQLRPRRRRVRAVLRDQMTFEARTFEELLAVPDTLLESTRAALVERYF